MLPFLSPWGEVWKRDCTLATLIAEFVALWERRATEMRKPPRLNLDAQAVKCCRDYSSFCTSANSTPAPMALARHRSYVQNLRPIIAATLWTRWLHLERALEVASRTGDRGDATRFDSQASLASISAEWPLSGTQLAFGRAASLQAVTRVKLQTSKVQSWTPTRRLSYLRRCGCEVP
jgi:hypothetical protein